MSKVLPFPGARGPNAAGLSREQEIEDGAQYVAEIAMTTANQVKDCAFAVLVRAVQIVAEGGGIYEDPTE